MKQKGYNLFIVTLITIALASMCGRETKNNNTGVIGHLPGPGFTLVTSTTTLVQTLVPVEPAENPVDPNNIPLDKLKNFGKFTIGQGEDFTFRNDLNIAGAVPTVPATSRSVVYFPVITDIHIMDTKSPMRFCDLDMIGPVQGAYRPQDRYTTQVLDAMIRTLNDFSKTRHYDFLMALGDTVDNTSTDEVRWFIRVLDGTVITPDSGKHIDIVPGPLNDPHDPFLPWGLDKQVPWYTTVGNHDGLVNGNFAVNTQYQSIATGNDVYMGSEDDYGNIIPAGTTITPDVNRALLGPIGYMQQFFTTATFPVGHGFSTTNITSGYGDYAFDPEPSVPLRVIVLDWECRNGGDNGCIRADEVNNFLIPELQQAYNDNKLVIVVSHQYPDALDKHTEITGTAFVNILATYPNVILHLVGHGHDNRITPHAGLSATQPGYWEIETSSLIDYPQQSRIIEVVDNGDGTGYIFATMVDHNSPDGSMSAISRSLALKDIQLGDNTSGAQGTPADRNAQLVIRIPNNVENALKNITLPSKIESLTTLKGI
ncbi:MAG: metallophosphoesterase [bacterium]